MRSSFMGLEVQKRSLQIAQKHLDIVGHNLGNAKTPGYTRQRVDVHSLHLSGNNHWFTNLTRLTLTGQGVSATGVSQIRNEYLDRRFREMVPQAAEHSTLHRIKLEIESTLDAVDTFSLLDAMNQLKSALERVALERTDAREMTSIVRNQAVNIASMLRTHHADLTKLLENNLWELERSIETTNNLIGRIVDYNAAITKEYLLDAGRIARGQGVSQYGPLEMLDQRNLLLDELAQFANIEVFQNTIWLVMAGVTIIDDQESLQIRMLNYNDFNAAVMTFSNGVGFNPSTGEIRAYMEMVNGNGPYATGKYQTSSFGIPYYINALNVFAAEFAAIMNDTMNASLRASGFAYPPSTIDGVMRADNSNWERNLIWAGYEYMYNEDGSYRLDILGNRIRRTEEVQARDSAGRLMVYAAGEQMSNIDGQLLWFDTDGRHTTTNTGNQVLAVGGEPVMIRSYIRAEINASNIMISDEWLDNELMIGETFLANAIQSYRPGSHTVGSVFLDTSTMTYYMVAGTNTNDPITGANVFNSAEMSIADAVQGGFIRQIDVFSPNTVVPEHTNTRTFRQGELFLDPRTNVYFRTTSAYTVGANGVGAPITDINSAREAGLIEVVGINQGSWQAANLDGANLHRFVQALEDPRQWGRALDFHGSAFEYLMFLSNRMAQGIDFVEKQFDMTMDTINTLLDNRDAISAVCETEEGIQMMTYQKWFNASARLMTTMDEALDTLINRMGRVGL
jgi:flagellar hook-associated protein FlgK